jgi:hypothetical protein
MYVCTITSKLKQIESLPSEQAIVLHINKGHFTHKTESPWPLHFKHSHWWKRRSWSKFASHYTWGTDGVCECKMDVKSTWIPTWRQMDDMCHGHLDYFQKPPIGGRPNTKPGDHGTPNAHNGWFILFNHAWRSTWIGIHWNSILLRTWSHMTSHYTWGSGSTLHKFGGVLGAAFGHFLLGSHIFMVTALGLCVKWPIGSLYT